MRYCATKTILPRKIFSFFVLFVFGGACFIQLHAEGSCGVAGGIGTAEYLMRFGGLGGSVPNYRNDGFEQVAVKTSSGWEIRTEVNLRPLKVREKWAMTKAEAKLISSLDEGLGKSLMGALGGVTSKDEAVIRVISLVNQKWDYVEKDDSALKIEELLSSKSLSCLGNVRVVKHLLDILRIPSAEVIGIRFPLNGRSYELKGGALHAWLEIEIEKGRKIFCDPRATFGFVPMNFIFLKVGDNLSDKELSLFQGGKVELLSIKDRIFFDPMSEEKPDLWKRASFDALVQGVLLGKVLDERDLPVAGRVSLSGENGEVVSPLWEGNFYFRALSTGLYTLRARAEGNAETIERKIELSDISRKKVVIYVKNGEISR